MYQSEWELLEEGGGHLKNSGTANFREGQIDKGKDFEDSELVWQSNQR